MFNKDVLRLGRVSLYPAKIVFPVLVEGSGWSQSDRMGKGECQTVDYIT